MNTNYYFFSWEICTDNFILKKVEQLYSIYTVIKYNVGNLNFELFSLQTFANCHYPQFSKSNEFISLTNK